MLWVAGEYGTPVRDTARRLLWRRETGRVVYWTLWLGVMALGGLIAITEFGAPWWLAAVFALVPALKAGQAWYRWWTA